MAVRPRSA